MPGKRIFEIHGNPIMTTSDIQKEGFVAWMPFNRMGKAELLRMVPSQFGVYVVRATKAIKRLRGESDIVYIASACKPKRSTRADISILLSWADADY